MLPKDREKILKSIREKIRTLEGQAPVYAFVKGSCSADVLERYDGNEKIWKWMTNLFLS